MCHASMSFVLSVTNGRTDELTEEEGDHFHPAALIGDTHIH